MTTGSNPRYVSLDEYFVWPLGYGSHFHLTESTEVLPSHAFQTADQGTGWNASSQLLVF